METALGRSNVTVIVLSLSNRSSEEVPRDWIGTQRRVGCVGAHQSPSPEEGALNERSSRLSGRGRPPERPESQKFRGD